MFGLGRGNIPADETIDWAIEGARFWLESFGGYETNRALAKVLTPTEEDFPVDIELEDDGLAQDYLALAVEHTQLSEMPFRLVRDEEPNVADALRGMPHHTTSSTPAQAEDQRIEPGEGLPIPYDISLLDDPEALLATIARGMSHYLLYHAPGELPFDEDDSEDHEYYVDLGAVFLGFGAFLANSSFRFQQVTEGAMIGWGASRRGALSELDVSFVLALYATLFELSDSDILPHLRPNPAGFFKSAKKHLMKKCAADLASLRAIPSTSSGPYR